MAAETVPAVINLNGGAALNFINSEYSLTNFAQLFAFGEENGGITIQNVTANINITGNNFVNMQTGSVKVSTLTLNNVIGGSNDTLFVINNPANAQNLQNSSFRSLTVSGGNVSVLSATNAYIEQFTKCSISNIQSPNYVI